jgi:hypothetical protein
LGTGAPPRRRGTLAQLKTNQRAAREKSSRYGELDLPYIVAVNVLADFGGEDEYVDALFGTPQIAVTADGRQVFEHDKDGSFGTPRHPRAQRVSAILCVRDLSPWSVAQEGDRRVLRMIRHPWASKPLPKGVLGISEHTEGDDFSQGEDARTRLGLIPDWPQNLAPFDRRLTRVVQTLNRYIPL